MRNTFRILFYIKKKAIRHDGKCPILCRITVMGDSVNMSTHLYVEPDDWSAGEHKTSGRDTTQRSINSRIERMRAMLEKIYFEKRLEHEAVYARLIKNVYLKQENGLQTILDSMRRHNKLFAREVGTVKSASTYKKYLCVYNHMQKFLQCFYDVTDMKLQDITLKFIKDFEYYLRQNHCSTNTVNIYMLPVKQILNEAFRHGEIPADPFTDYKFKYERRQRGYLTQNELNRLMNDRTDSATENLVRNLFIFSCFTGLSYSDICLLTHDHLTVSFDNHLWISTSRKKSGTGMKIRLLDIPLSIINRYGSGQGRVFDVPSNKTCNHMLRSISNRLGFKPKVTFHTSRHNENYFYL